MASRRRSAAAETRLLTAALTGIALALGALAPVGSLVGSPGFPHGVSLVAFLVLGFAVAEACLLHVEVRREAYSVTLAGVPLTLGLLTGSTREVLLARLVGSAVILAWQRPPLQKVAYNVAAYGAEVGLMGTALHLAVRPSANVPLSTVLACYLVLAVVDQVMSLLVCQIIVWHQGPMGARQVGDVLLPALIWSVMAVTGAVTVLELVDQGIVGVVVLALLLAAAAAGYRGYQVLHRRHQALEQLHSFMALASVGDSVQDLAVRLLSQIRELMRAEHVELLLEQSDDVLSLRVGEDGQLRVNLREPLHSDRMFAATSAADNGLLLRPGNRDPDVTAWLSAQRVREAVLVPLPRAEPGGVLMVLGRLGDTGSFTRDDQTLLLTLAGHLAIAVSNTQLLERLRYDATHDALTGLANRVLVNEAITTALAGPRAATTVVFLLDLNRFKEVNDSLGHHAGDALLRTVATRLTTVLPEDATVARLGGDEFAAVLIGLTDPGVDAQRLAHSIGAALGEPINLPEATNLRTSVSIGIALASDLPGDTQLLRHADAAMYAAKDTESLTVTYTPELDRARLERISLTADLRLALERPGELTLRYQPKLDLRTGDITGVEALVRWQHPRLGFLAPDVFIPLAESTGLIEDITHIVLISALTQCASWRAAGLDLTVAVNLSGRSVTNENLPDLISKLLLQAGVPASRLVLEITESSIVRDLDRAVPILSRVAAIGVTLSLDDFGTGYSSLAYLQRLPVGELKIDRSFVSRLGGDSPGETPASEVLVRTVISLAQSLQLRVVAEGVENEETLQLLRRLGCDTAQGYHVSRPELPQAVAELVEQNERAARPALSIAR